MKQGITLFLSVFIVLFSILCSSCKDIVFDNPLDPNASKGVVQVIRVIDTPLVGRGDIAFDGEKFWKASPSSDLSAFDRESGIVIRSFPGVPGTGVALFNHLLYVCNGEVENILYVVDPLSGDIFNRISTRDIYPGYITTSGDKLLVFDIRSYGIFEYNTETGQSTRLFALPGLQLGGITRYKSDLLITDMSTDSIYQLSMTGDIKKVFSSPVQGIGGIGVDNSDYVYLFITNGKVYKVTLP